MKVQIRVDATLTIGAGHVTRCLALGMELRARGADVEFIVGRDCELAADLVSAQGFRCRTLNAGPADAQDDAEETARILTREQAEWVVVDHYALDATWEERVARSGAKVLAIEDLSHRRHDCDLVVDSSFQTDGGAPAPSPAGLSRRRILQGPKYAMLRPEFGRARVREHAGIVRRIMVSYGGTDPTNETCKALEALAAVATRGLTIDVAVGAAFPHEAALLATARQVPNVKLHRGLPHLAELMQACDLALGAGGTSIWERFCLGLPAIVTTTAANQTRSTAALAAAGYFLHLGAADQVTRETIQRGLQSKMADQGALRRESALGRALVDGMGTARVADAMEDKPARRAAEASQH